MSGETRALYVKLNKAEVERIKALSREFGMPMEEVCSRLIIHALEELTAEAQAAESLPAGERQRLAYDEAVSEMEAQEAGNE